MLAGFRRRRAGILLLLALVGLHHPAFASAVASPRCAPAEGVQFICGTGAAEEAVVVPGTPWLITSALNVGAPAVFHVVDTTTRQARPLAVSFAPRPAPDPGGCATQPDPARWSTDGLAIAHIGDGRFRLFAANHGDRRAIEIFDVAQTAAGPVLRWTGCAMLPPGTLGNAVAAVTAGEIYVTSFHAFGDAAAWRRMARREPTGTLWHWQAGRGFEQVAIGPVSGANGLALSADRQTLYLSAWSERALLVIDRRTRRSRRIPLDFLPDNIHLTRGGMLLVGGQRTTVAAIGGCGAQCPQPWLVARIDPETGRQRVIVEGRGSTRINYACGALEAGGGIYITVRGDDRLAYLPAARAE